MDLKKRWEETFDNSVSSSLDEIRITYTDPLGLEVEEIPYEFVGIESEWMGAYLRKKNLLKDGKIVFALNRDKIYDRMKSCLLHRSMRNTKMQAQILVYHEVGHGLLDYVRSLQPTEIQIPNVDDETIVTEFARHSSERYTLEFNSILEKLVFEIIRNSKNHITLKS